MPVNPAGLRPQTAPCRGGAGRAGRGAAQSARVGAAYCFKARQRLIQRALFSLKLRLPV